MKRYDVYGIGNALIDSDARINEHMLQALDVEPSVMTLIDAKRHQVLVQALDGHFVHHGCGGSAANTMIALQQLGGSGFYSCKVADDERGRLFLKELLHRGIDCNQSLTQLPSGTTGQCLVMVTEDAERTMNTHLGLSETISESDISIEALIASNFLYLEGYLVTSKSGLAAMTLAAAIARVSQVKIAITLSDPNIVRHFRQELLQIIADGIDLIFCNEDEARIFTNSKNTDEAILALRQLARHVVVTRGNRGVSIVYEDEQISVPTHKVKSIDTLGAGDMFAGTYLYAVCQGHEPHIAAVLANRLSAEVVSQYGARLQDVQVKSIQSEFLGSHFGLYSNAELGFVKEKERIVA